MTARPRLSGIVPNYNHARFLPESLRALVDQSYQSVEFIVVDDGSTDDSVEIIRRFAQADPRLRLIRNERNRGGLYCAQGALAEACGEYIYFAAADDRVLPGFFEKSAALLERHPQAGACSGLVAVMDAEGRSQGIFDPLLISDKECYVAPERAMRILRRHGTWYMGPATIFRRAALMEAGGLRSELGPLADDFLFQVIALRHGVCFIPEPLAVWRRMEGTYSETLCADSETAQNILRVARRLMRSTYRDLFSDDYAARWEGRWLFGTSSHRLSSMRRKQIAVLKRPLSSQSVTGKMFLWCMDLFARFSDMVVTVYLFARFRRADMWSVTARRFLNKK